MSLRKRLEGWAVLAVYGAFAALPLDWSSGLAGAIARTVGPRLRLSRRARANLQACFPDWDEARLEAVLDEMWDNLGRVAGEFPHLKSFTFGPGERVEVEGLEHLEALRDDGRPGILFSAHMGNWELEALCAARIGLPMGLVYRAANNPLVEKLYVRGRADIGTYFPKGAQGARQVLAWLNQGGHLGMLVDQKMNDGIPVPFFGRDAMTAPALAQFALKYRCPVVPAHVVRIGGARFKLVIEPPIDLPDSGDRHADLMALMTKVNAVIEGWVRASPGQWLWLHRRWGKEGA